MSRFSDSGLRRRWQTTTEERDKQLCGFANCLQGYKSVILPIISKLDKASSLLTIVKGFTAAFGATLSMIACQNVKLRELLDAMGVELHGPQLSQKLVSRTSSVERKAYTLLHSMPQSSP